MKKSNTGSSYERLLGSGLLYVSFRLRSSHEIQTYIEKAAKRLGGTQVLIDQVTARLEELGYIDDTKFSTTYIESLRSSKLRGKQVLIQKLRQKGVSGDIIEQILTGGLSDERQREEETEIARKLLNKKYAHFQKYPPRERKARLILLLRRHGFSYAIAASLIDEVAANGYNTDSD